MAYDLQKLGQLGTAEQVLRAGVERYPNDFWLNHNLGILLKQLSPPKTEESVRFLTVALALRPRSAAVHLNLGNALRLKPDLDGSIRCYQAALAIDSNYAWAHNNLGAALHAKGDHEGAIRSFRAALALDPGNPMANRNLGLVLDTRGDRDAAIRHYRMATDLDPKYVNAHKNLATALFAKRDSEGAVRHLRIAIDLDPTDADAHYNLAAALYQKRQVDQAIHHLRTVIKLQPKDVQAHYNLGNILKEKGNFPEAIRYYQAALDLNPKLGDHLRLQHRYNAACAAALAGCGQGEDAAKLDDKERRGLRKQALDWLRADLAAWSKVLEKDPQSRPAVQKTMQHWRQDKDFAGVRGDALAKLPEPERKEWQKLWEDVEALCKRAASSK